MAVGKSGPSSKLYIPSTIKTQINLVLFVLGRLGLQGSNKKIAVLLNHFTFGDVFPHFWGKIDMK